MTNFFARYADNGQFEKEVALPEKLPDNPSLEHLRKQAKKLRAGEAGGMTLAAAQLAIARKYGFASWSKLKAHVERLPRDANALIEAACTGKLAQARDLLASAPELGRTNIFAACVTGEFETVEAIVERDPAAANACGGPLNREPLLYVCYSRFLGAGGARAKQMVRIARLLLDSGAGPNVYYREGEYRQTPLYGASGLNHNPDLTQLLLERGADPNDEEALYHVSEVADHACLRLLLSYRPKPDWAAYCLGHKLMAVDDPEGVRIYLESGVDVNIPMRGGVFKGSRLLHLAIQSRNSRRDVMEMLLQHGADAGLADAHGRNAMQIAVREANQDAIDLLRAHGAGDSGLTLADRFLGACRRGDEAEVLQLLRAHPDLVAGLTSEDRKALPQAAQRGNAAAVRLMLDAGIPSDTEQYDGFTALQWAAIYGYQDVLEICLERGCPLEQRNHYGGTVLGAALWSALTDGRGDAHAPIIRQLLEAGADSEPLRRCAWPTGYPAIDDILRPYRE